MSVLIPAIGRSLGPAIRSVFSLSDAAPTYYWDFRPGRLDANMSFTRASSGWYFNSAGLLVQAAVNAPRFDYDPVTLQPLSYLAEMQSTNAIVSSQALTGASWAATSLTVTDNAQTSPDGTANASAIVAPAAASAHIVSDAASFSATLNSVYGLSFFAKNISGSMWAQMSVAGSFFMNVNPATGAIGSTSANISSATARQLSNGWWRFSCFFTADATATKAVALGLVQATGSVYHQSFTGDGTSTVAIWGVQVETAGVGVTSYIPTAGSAVTRAVDLLSLPLTSLPGWSPSKGGVLVAAYRMNTSRPFGVQGVASMSDGPFNNAVVMYENQSGVQFLGRTTAGGVLNDVLGANSAALFARRKTAFGWGPSRHQIAHDGIFDASNAGQTLPTGMANLRIGTDDGTNSLNGTIESIAYYAGARSDAFVQAVSR